MPNFKGQPQHQAPGRVALVATPETLAPTHAWALASGLGTVCGVATPGPVAQGALASVGAIEHLGTLEDLATAHVRLGIRTLVVCLPSPLREAAARASTIARTIGLRLVQLPCAFDAAPATPTGIGADLDPEALIGRGGAALDASAIARARRALTGKRALITGAGGSIGSELARIVAGFQPESIILMERSENALFEIDRQLAARFPRVPRKAMLHDVVEHESTAAWLQRLRPQVVFHAAAHKHVTLMEDHPSHAVNNNFFGTRSIADASADCGAERFVMISTDKAVNPRSVMGATKRFAELYVRSLNGRSGGMRSCMVRFGNVLGSACSVIPIWTRQLAEGGPITVTHPEMTRYFMTIREAASLVIQAGALTEQEAAGASVFVLDMGEPIRIVELAERFVRLHGMEPRFAPDAPGPNENAVAGAPMIDVVFTGARPGEKLNEELAHASESLRPTPAAGVMAWAADPSEILPRRMAQLVEDLSAARWSPDREEVLRLIRNHAQGVGEAAPKPDNTNKDLPKIASAGLSAA